MKNNRILIAVTIDYETWHPIPKGKTINWGKDIFQPAEKLLQIFDQEQVKLTVMAEMGEYFWLQKNDPEISHSMEEQWKAAIRCGHDVQLHLHPNWLPELGARFEDGNWVWDWTKAKASEYPGDLGELIRRCKSAIETILREVNPSYQVICFRAGAYQVQPFKRLYDALVINEIFCDSSTYAGGYSIERGHDFRLAYSDHQPYFANPYDPQLKAPPSEHGIVEIPVFTFEPNKRWFLDGTEGDKFAGRLLSYLRKKERFNSNSKLNWQKRFIKRGLGTYYYYFKPIHGWLNFIIPKPVAHFMTHYDQEILAKYEYFVLIGHSKADLDFEGIRRSLCKLKEDGRFMFMTLSGMAKIARQELLHNLRENSLDEADYQVRREYQAILGSDRNGPQSYYLQEMIPWDRKNVLDLGCGAGYWTYRISQLYPWMEVTGIDFGVDFISEAKRKYISDRVSFKEGDFNNLSFTERSFDCVYADNTLEHAYDVDKTLSEVYLVLREDGVLVAAIPSDGRNPRKICDNHTWKTVPHEVRLRLENAGFVNIEIEEVDTFRKFGMPPYPPSDDKMMYIRAWKRHKEITQIDRALEAMDWVYNMLNPEKSQDSDNPSEIIKRGYAYCWGYVIILGKLLEKERYSVKWVTMLAKNHPRGRGQEKIDSHEVLTVIADGKEVILDPMANTCIPYPLHEVLTNPRLAKVKENPDNRYIARGYHLYDTEFWYSRLFKYAIRKDYKRKILFWQKVNR